MKKFFSLAICAVAVLLVGCEPIISETAPTVQPVSVIDVKCTSATVECEVSSDGGASLTERGVVYSTSNNPTLMDNKIQNDGRGIGKYTCEIVNLQENTTYYVRAYAINAVDTIYSEEISFTTLWRGIDLGLSVKWATYNIGATKPEEFGHYFAWGEIEPKDTVTVDNYKWMTSYDSYTKYCINSDLGNVDNKTILEAGDDAATVYWGEQWRMPTYEECVELVEKCTWTWTTQNEVEGYLVVGPNGNSIFLPSAGLRIMETHFPIRVSYWSSSLYTSDENTYCQTRCARGFDCRKNLQPGVAQFDREVTSIPIRAVQP
jgi:hypothetical protein